jgi:cytidylate kinase
MSKHLLNEAVDELSTLSIYLQRTKQKLQEQMIAEGVDDPGIFKCVFLAGGPGSGKGFMSKEIFGVVDYTKFAPSGLKVVNSDAAFEAGLKKNGIDPKDLAKIEKEDPQLWDRIQGKSSDSIRNVAKGVTKKLKDFYEAGRLGMIIDGTGHEYDKIAKQKAHAEELGYDCYMVFVNTSLEVAKERNLKRSRVVPEELLVKSWKACQENMGKFQRLFGGYKFSIVDNSVEGVKHGDVTKAASRFIAQPIVNPIAKKWMITARALKGKIVI